MLVNNEIGASMAIFMKVLTILLICVESDKIPLIRKLKQFNIYKRLPMGFLIAIAYTANGILYKLYTKMASLFLVYG